MTKKQAKAENEKKNSGTRWGTGLRCRLEALVLSEARVKIRLSSHASGYRL